ncbi:MAG: DNA mismatch repair protein MutS [Prevotella sp.]|nr:DNA mismatch repair protein MutS [Prevotella sp.]MCM1074536.1 DNA mismatch repair protein MutS [Ruminococcus sp.]
MAKVVETPLMKQYFEMKKKHPDAVLLFRVGDFYETFSEDAITASEILGITLTRRANGKAMHVELAGFPHHALDTYLPKLIRAGKRVAICEQLEDPKLTKKLVKRDITELVTPGVNISDSILSGRENNFLAGIHFGAKHIGVAFLDISTGEYLCAEGNADYIDKLLNGIRPKEILILRGLKAKASETFQGKHFFFELDDWIFTMDAAMERLLRHFETKSLKGFGVNDMPDAVIAAGSLLHYMDITRHPDIAHITALSRIDEDKYVRLDRFTIRNLELITPMGEGGKSLVDILDKTVSPMGARLLRRWVLFPLRDIHAIQHRHNVVEYFFRHPDTRHALQSRLETVGDLERIISKVAVGRVSPRELVQLKNALLALVPVKTACTRSTSEELRAYGAKTDTCEEMVKRIDTTIIEDAPSLVSRGNFIAEGVDSELDDLRHLASSGKQYLNEMLAREIAATGINSLKISFNNVFGYYIEVRNTYKDKVPDSWIRKQTLVSAERYITPELKEYEQKILGAEEKISSIETRIFNELVQYITDFIRPVQANSAVVAELDCLLAFTSVAEDYRYIRPQVDDEIRIDITAGRHPVIERQLPPGEPYIANSLCLNAEKTQIMMITGPNMSGKSALLRQTALITLMAQIGSFVPADAATIGIVDKIFTRVGASDNISLGESTFMVEMNEAASILNNMSPRSLILFDELGRGTSTYDGISIAWAIVEHIHQNTYAHPLTLFATHYHELNEMEKLFPRIANFNVAVEEKNGKVIFVRKLQPGGSAHSFGIHVARLAGLPKSIVNRADAVLSGLEKAGAEANNSTIADTTGIANAPAADAVQMSFFQLDDPLLSQIRDNILDLDIDNLTPLQALQTLHNLKSLLTGK